MAETGDFENQGIDTLSESDIGESSEALLSFPGGFSMDLWRVLADDVEKRTDLDVVASSAAKFESHGAWQVLVEGQAASDYSPIFIGGRSTEWLYASPNATNSQISSRRALCDAATVDATVSMRLNSKDYNVQSFTHKIEWQYLELDAAPGGIWAAGWYCLPERNPDLYYPADSAIGTPAAPVYVINEVKRGYEGLVKVKATNSSAIFGQPHLYKLWATAQAWNYLSLSFIPVLIPQPGPY